MSARHPTSDATGLLSRHLNLATPVATDQLGARMAPLLGPGDCVALSGPMGAGKSHLARAIIRARLGDQEAAVPSPSYTLVNVYTIDAGEIWHADLYRLGGDDDMTELGLEEALSEAILLVEWPERWPDLPERRLEVALRPTGAEQRLITLVAHGDWTNLFHALEETA